MNRFFHNGDGFHDGSGEEGEGEQVPDIDTNDILGMMEMDLAEMGLNQQLLDCAIQLASKEWLWRFRSDRTKVHRVSTIYRKLSKLILDGDTKKG
jgi:hypothetical protein